MLWSNCLVLFAFAVLASAGILPDEFAGAKRSETSAVPVPDEAVWKEYGHEASEKAVYGPTTVTARRFKDTTGAFAALEWLDGDPAVKGKLTLVGNYVLQFEGGKPTDKQAAEFGAKLPELRRTSLPSLLNFVPGKNRVPSSGRYLLGPASLAKGEPSIPAEVVGFEQGAEGYLARYRGGGGEQQLLVVAYPTPQIAMKRLKGFLGLPNAVARRSGTMVAVVVLPGSPAAAEQLVNAVEYTPSITWNEKAPEDLRKAGVMFVSIFTIAGFLMGGSVLLGVFFGTIRRVFALAGIQLADDSFTSLNLQG